MMSRTELRQRSQPPHLTADFVDCQFQERREVELRVKREEEERKRREEKRRQQQQEEQKRRQEEEELFRRKQVGSQLSPPFLGLSQGPDCRPSLPHCFRCGNRSYS